MKKQTNITRKIEKIIKKNKQLTKRIYTLEKDNENLINELGYIGEVVIYLQEQNEQRKVNFENLFNLLRETGVIEVYPCTPEEESSEKTNNQFCECGCCLDDDNDEIIEYEITPQEFKEILDTIIKKREEK